MQKLFFITYSELSETNLWTYWTYQNRFVDLLETSLCQESKGFVSLSEVGLRPTSLNLTNTFEGDGLTKLVCGPMC